MLARMLLDIRISGGANNLSAKPAVVLQYSAVGMVTIRSEEE